MANIHLTIGHNVGNVRRWSLPDVCEAFERLTGVEAYTAIPCYGMWRGTQEESTRIEVVTDQPARILDNVPALSALLGQEAIMVEEVNAKTTFIVPAHNAA